MIFKNSVSDSVRRNGGIEKKKSFPGRAYVRFFEGYTETVVPSANGKRNRIVRIYTADYYRHALDDRHYVLLKLLYTGLYLLLLLSFVTAAIEPIASNMTWYITLPQMFCVFFLGWMFLGITKYFFAERIMTVYSYHSSTSHLRRAAAGLCISLAVLSLTSILYLLLHFGTVVFPDVTCSIRFCLCFGIAALIYYVERQVPYERVPNEKKEQIKKLL